MTRVRPLADGLVVLAALVLECVVWGGQPSIVPGVTLPPGVVPVVLVLVYSLLLLRWRCPLGIFCLQWAFAALFLLVPHVEPFAGLLIALHAAGARLTLFRAVAALVSTLLVFLTYSQLSVIVAQARGHPLGFANVATLWTVLCLLVWGVGRLSYSLARQELRLRELELSEALAAERLRLARELHDIVAHAVTVMILQAAGARAAADPRDDRTSTALGAIEGVGVHAMADLRRLLGVLRSAEAGPAAGQGPPRLADLPDLVDRFRAGGQQVTVTGGRDSGRVDPEVELAVYRIVQEALTNIAKHGDSTAVARVALSWAPDTLAVRITSRVGDPLDRTTVDRLSSGLGLQGLRERVSLLGGTLVTGRVADRYDVVAQLPRSGSAPLARSVDPALVPA